MPESDQPSSQTLSEVLRQLNHDLRSPLSTIAMGLEAIRVLKHDPAQVDALLDMMNEQGIEEIKRILNRLQ